MFVIKSLKFSYDTIKKKAQHPTSSFTTIIIPIFGFIQFVLNKNLLNTFFIINLF